MPVRPKVDKNAVIAAWNARRPHESKRDIARRCRCDERTVRDILASAGDAVRTLRTGDADCAGAAGPLYVPPPVLSSHEPEPGMMSVIRKATSRAVEKLSGTMENQIRKFQELVSDDVCYARMKFREFMESEDSRVNAVGIELWDRAIKHGRLNLGLPSEISPNTGGPSTIINITSQSDKRRIVAPAP